MLCDATKHHPPVTHNVANKSDTFLSSVIVLHLIASSLEIDDDGRMHVLVHTGTVESYFLFLRPDQSNGSILLLMDVQYAG